MGYSSGSSGTNSRLLGRGNWGAGLPFERLQMFPYLITAPAGKHLIVRISSETIAKHTCSFKTFKCNLDYQFYY